MTDIVQVPLGSLVITKTNARRDHSVDRSLLASIGSVGLLYPLTVDVLPDGSYDVVDGAQRLVAIREGLETGALPPGLYDTLPCLLRANGSFDRDGLEISLHANLRTPMHPLDECDAILELSKRGEMSDDIALRFGKDVKWLEQRVKLASLSEEVKTAFRDGKIGLHATMLFTLGSPEQQRAFLKRHKKADFTVGQLNAAMTEKKILATYANFDLALYPEEKIQRDLFADDNEGVWLLDRALYLELQDQWLQEEIESLKQLGYDEVKCLEQDDWQTLNGYVEVTAKADIKTPEQRAKLSCFLKADHYGYIHVHRNMARRKEVGKAAIAKAKNGAATDTASEEPKPINARQLTPLQEEIVNGLAATALFNVLSGGKADDKLMQYVVYLNQFGRSRWVDSGVSSNAFRHNGTRARWDKLREAYPDEAFVEADEAFDKTLEKSVSYADWCALKPGERNRLFCHAVASMVMAPGRGLAFKAGDKMLDGLDWLNPGKDFFKRYRTDQLIDYRKRSGDKEAGATAKKKEDHVADCVKLSGFDGAYGLGLVK
jgi:ParB-like chromosome segregation protein Spo0J